MSELSEKYAVTGGNRRKYCLKIGMFITSCILDKTCDQCKIEINDDKQPIKPRKELKNTPIKGINARQNDYIIDPKRPNKPANNTGIGAISDGNAHKTLPNSTDEKVCRRRRSRQKKTGGVI